VSPSRARSYADEHRLLLRSWPRPRSLLGGRLPVVLVPLFIFFLVVIAIVIVVAVEVVVDLVVVEVVVALVIGVVVVEVVVVEVVIIVVIVVVIVVEFVLVLVGREDGWQQVDGPGEQFQFLGRVKARRREQGACGHADNPRVRVTAGGPNGPTAI